MFIKPIKKVIAVKTTTLKGLRKTFFFLLLGVTLISSCKKKNGDGVLLEEEVEDPNIEILSGTISEPRVLYNRFSDPNVLDYKVPASVLIASSLTIMPGVMIEMGPGAKFTVSSTGKLRSLGSADSNVVFTGRQKTPGYWDYIMINSFDSTNQMNNTVVEYGGGNPNLEASVILNGTSILKMQNSKIKYSESYGLSVLQRESQLPGFTNNVIQESGLAPIQINSSQMSAIDNSNALNMQNVYNHIEVIGSEVYTLQSWKKTDVPFYLTNATTISADLVIEPGARFVFGPAGRILVNSTGSLSALGLNTDSIYFSGNQSISGYWDCILFLSNNPYNEFKYVSIKNGGGYWYWNACIYLQDAYFKISYSTIANGARWGIYRNGVYNFEDGGFNNFLDNAIGPVGP